MTDVRDNYLYTNEHEWLLVEDDVVTVGITAYAQDSLGDMVFVELPEVGKTFSREEEFAVVESVKAASEVYIPVSGEVIEVNEDLEEAPESINNSPYDDGWIAKVKMSDPKELEDCMDANTYAAYVEGLE